MSYATQKINIPPASIGYREELARMLRARLDDNKARAVAALLSNRKFAPTDPTREDTARMIVEDVLSALLRTSLLLLLAGLALSARATAALAYAPVSENHPIETTCIERDELAGVVNAEAGAQLPDVQLRVMQIFVNEAESRGITFCALSHLTRFSGVRAYVRTHPGSYLEWRLNNPPEELLLMADDVLLHRVEDVTGGARHFDGDGQRIIFRP